MSKYQEYQAVDVSGNVVALSVVVVARDEQAAHSLIQAEMMARGLQNAHHAWRQGGYKIIAKDV